MKTVQQRKPDESSLSVWQAIRIAYSSRHRRQFHQLRVFMHTLAVDINNDRCGSLRLLGVLAKL